MSTSTAVGAVFRDCEKCPEMVSIPGGRFEMGSVAAEPGRFEDEGPRLTITFARPFAVSRTPITRAEFDFFLRASGRAIPEECARMSAEGRWVRTTGLDWRNPGFAQTADHPVVCVSWDDAFAYAKWISAETGRAYRLLTEAEYEYVARAGSVSMFPWGDSADNLCSYANGFDASAGRLHPDWPAAACDDGYPFTSPVRSFPANAFGVFDVTGNVFQWTEDCFVEGGYVGMPTDGSARVVAGCEVRVIRGGSWLNSSRGLRSAMRDHDRQGDRYTNVGFRVARDG